MKALGFTAIVVLVALTAVGAAASDRAPVQEDHSDVPAGYAWVGGSKATCTPRKCRFPVTCDASVADPAHEAPCVAFVALTSRGRLLTETPIYLLDPDIPLDEQPQPIPDAEGHLLGLGQTKTLTLKTFKIPGFSSAGAIKNALRKGKRTLPGGGYEVLRPELLTGDPDYPLVFEYGPVQIKIKR